MGAETLALPERIGVAMIRRARALSGIDQIRLVGAALLLFFIFDHVRMVVQNPAMFANSQLAATMDLFVYVAFLIALWRPRLGLFIGAVPLVIALVWPSTSMDALVLGLLIPIGLSRLDRRSAMAVSILLVGYVALRIGVASEELRVFLTFYLGLSALAGLVLGWVVLHIRERHDKKEAESAQAALETARIRADERRSLSRELHDVIAHQLSTASLQIMGSESLHDPEELHRVIRTVDRANAEALTELRLLVRVLRDDPATAASGTEIRELSQMQTPTQAAAAAELQLLKHGFEPDVRVPASMDGLEMTVQRTLSRFLRECVDNVIQHAPTRSRCQIRARVTDQQVSLHVRNPVPPGFEEPPLGWGLRGLRERIRLTGGTFSVQIVGDEWIVSVTLPHD